MDDFHQGEKYSSRIDIHQGELRREEISTDKKCLSIPSLQTDYLNLSSRSGCGKIGRQQILFRQSVLFLEVPNILNKNVSKGSEKKREKLVRLVIRVIDVRNVRLTNFLDAYLNIISFQNF